MVVVLGAAPAGVTRGGEGFEDVHDEFVIIMAPVKLGVD